MVWSEKRDGGGGELSIGLNVEPLLPARVAIGQLIYGGTEEHRTLEKRHDSKANPGPARVKPSRVPICPTA
jgi:hypothetical protein